MKITTRSQYALLALVYLARNNDKGHISAQKIAGIQGISPKYLEQILFILKRAKFLRGHRGQGGGYILAKPADKINLAEIIRLFDGALAPTESVSVYFYKPTPIEKEESLIEVFREIRDYIADKLENTTLADIGG
jgi:Rrf2 family cysteine metabolism transcriptional repressor